MLKYLSVLLLILLVHFAKAQDTITIELNKDSITPKGCSLHVGHGFMYYSDEIYKHISTDKTVKPGLYNLEYKNKLVAKVRHISKNENIIYYYNADSTVREIRYEPYFEITLYQNKYVCNQTDYKMGSVHIYDKRIWLIDFNYYMHQDFYIRVLNRKKAKSFELLNLEFINQ